MIDKGKLNLNGGIEIFEKIAPVLKNGGLIVLLSKLIVNIQEPNGLGIETLVHAANAVRTHFTVADAVLC